jgi:hypothetical protein
MSPKISVRKRFPRTIVVNCDESSQNGHRYFVVGAVFFALKETAEIEKSVQRLEKYLEDAKTKHSLTDTIKWVKVPTSRGQYFDGYKSFLKVFLESRFINFKCMIVDTSKYPLGNRDRWGGDPLVGYLKFYCVFLSDGVLSRYAKYFFDVRLDQYAVRPDCDHRLLEETVVKRFVKKRGPEACLEYCCVKPLDHREHNLLQIADLLVGAVAFVWNEGLQRTSRRSGTRQELVRLIENVRKVDLGKPTAWANNWFNIWELKPKESWASGRVAQP